MGSNRQLLEPYSQTTIINTGEAQGNVWEWTGGWFRVDYYQKGPKNNPTGPGSGKFRVRRGGASANLTSHIRSLLTHLNIFDSYNPAFKEI